MKGSLTPQEIQNTDPQKVLKIVAGHFRHDFDNRPKQGEPGFKPYTWSSNDWKSNNMFIQVLDYIGAPHDKTYMTPQRGPKAK